MYLRSISSSMDEINLKTVMNFTQTYIVVNNLRTGSGTPARRTTGLDGAGLTAENPNIASERLFARVRYLLTNYESNGNNVF